MPDIVRVLRIVEYMGERTWVEETVRRAVHGTRRCGGPNEITAVTIHEYPQILERAETREENEK